VATLLCIQPTLTTAQALVITLTATELSHVHRIATRCRDSKQCLAVFEESFQGLGSVLAHYRTIKEPSSQSRRESLAGLGRTYVRVAPGPMAHSQRRTEALRLMQGLAVAYENMTRNQRRRAVLRDRAFLPALAPLLEVTAPDATLLV